MEIGIAPQKMNAFLNYDEKKERRLSVVLGCMGLVGTTASFLLWNEWITAVLLFLTIGFFLQHHIGKALLKNRLLKKIQYDFPNWLSIKPQNGFAKSTFVLSIKELPSLAFSPKCIMQLRNSDLRNPFASV